VGRVSTDGRPTVTPGRRSAWDLARAVGTVLLTVLAFTVVWYALVGPNKIERMTPAFFLRLPLEGLVVAVLVIVLPARARRVVAVLVGVLLGLLSLLKLVDLGFYAALDRPFNPVTDSSYFGPALGVLSDSIGHTGAVVSLVVVIALVLAVLALMTLAVLRLSRLANGHPTTATRAVAALAVGWLLFAVTGAQFRVGVPLASTAAVDLAYNQAREVRGAVHEKQAFERTSAVDAFRQTPGDQLLTGLRGKDVLFVFVESYGRVAVQGSTFSPGVDDVLDRGTRTLRSAGFDARSAFLTSPTFGAISWLAHSTFQSGLWVDSQERYDALVTSHRLTLSDAFKRAGWRTVVDVPANTKDWPQSVFYDYDKVYDSRNVGYAGPRFGYPTMPDQYTLDAFHRLELRGSRRLPVMAEIDLISSHAPWSRTPHMIPQSQVGDGSVFEGMPDELPSETEIWRSADRVRKAYGQSIQYSLDALIAFMETYGNDHTVLVLLGDHQPATIVSGDHADHDVPVTVVAPDRGVLHSISGWGWERGMLPSRNAPVWRMDAFRDRFLVAFGP
jgi:hypothetical protein